MENLNYHDLDELHLINTNDSQNPNVLSSTNLSHKSNSTRKSDFTLSNPIYTEMTDFKITKDDVEYEFQISFKNEKWLVKRNFSEIKNLISTLRGLKYAFLPDEYFQNLPIINQSTISNLNIKEINLEILNFLRYINYRFDVISNILTQEFLNFNKSSYQADLIKRINSDNLEQIFKFILDEIDMTVSDFLYDPELGLLVISLEDVSLFSTLGRFWSLIDYEILGSCLIYQRVFDKNDRPYFRKTITKNFDARVSCLEFNSHHHKIFVGLENGSVQIFNINILDKTTNNTKNNKTSNTNNIEDSKIIVINEGNNFRYLNDRITSMKSFNEFLFISSKENKLIIVDVSKSIMNIRFNGSLKKRVQGKGHIKKILVEPITKQLFVVMVTNRILVYDIITVTKFSEIDKEIYTDVKIDYLFYFDCRSNIKDVFVKGHSLIVALDNRIQIFKTYDKKNLIDNSNVQNENENMSEIVLDGTLPEGISFSSKYVRIDYSSFITAICYFTDNKMIFLGLSNGVLIAFNSRSVEIIYAKKICENPICKLILLEDNYILITGDEKGNILFFRFG